MLIKGNSVHPALVRTILKKLSLRPKFSRINTQSKVTYDAGAVNNRRLDAMVLITGEEASVGTAKI